MGILKLSLSLSSANPEAVDVTLALDVIINEYAAARPGKGTLVGCRNRRLDMRAVFIAIVCEATHRDRCARRAAPSGQSDLEPV